MKSALLARDEGWEVWTDWYDARLRGDPVDWDLEEKRVLIPEEIWAQGPKVVNAEIARLIEEHRRHPSPPAPEAEPFRLPPQVEAAALGAFALDPETNTLRLVPRPEERPDLGAPPIRRDFANRVRALGQGLGEMAEDMDGQVNVAPVLLRTLRRYRDEAAKEPIEEIIPDRLKSLADLLRDACADEDHRHMMGALFAPALSRRVATHDRLMRDFYGDALARMEGVEGVLADPDADLTAIAAKAAHVPRLLAEETPPDFPRASTEFQELADEMAADIADMDRMRQLLAGSRREEAERHAIIQTKRLVATVSTFAVRVLGDAAVELREVGGRLAPSQCLGLGLRLRPLRRPRLCSRAPSPRRRRAERCASGDGPARGVFRASGGRAGEPPR